MAKQTVAVIFGGVSPEHEISKLSAATVMANIPDEKYNVIPVYITKEGQWLLYDGGIDNIKNIRWEKCGTPAILSPDRTRGGLLRIVGEKVKNIPVDVVFPVLHGANGEDGTIQGLFEIAGIPYVGCGVFASAAAMDKTFTKIIAERLGVKQAPYLSYKAGEMPELSVIARSVGGARFGGFPCFVKPARAGSSVGISKVNNKKELGAAIEKALKFDSKVLIEKAVVGRELECAVLGSGGKDTDASAIGEIILNGSEFYDYDAKYVNDNAETLAKADLPEETADEIRQTAVKIFKAIEGSGLARVDFFLEEATGKVIFNEINTIPGFTAISLYPNMWAAKGMGMSELIDRLIQLAFER